MVLVKCSTFNVECSFFFLPSILEEESKDIFLQDVKFDMVSVKFAKPGYFSIISFRSLLPDGRGMIRRDGGNMITIRCDDDPKMQKALSPA